MCAQTQCGACRMDQCLRRQRSSHKEESLTVWSPLLDGLFGRLQWFGLQTTGSCLFLVMRLLLTQLEGGQLLTGVHHGFIVLVVLIGMEALLCGATCNFRLV